MFQPNSRYYGLRTRVLTTADGRAVSYVDRRLVPRSANLQLLQEVTTAQGDRLDLIAARTLGDPEQYWRICDANDAMNPVDLADRAGRRLRVPVPYSHLGAPGAPAGLPVRAALLAPPTDTGDGPQ